MTVEYLTVPQKKRNVLKNIKANWKRFLWQTGKAKQTGNTMISLSLTEINTKFIVL